MQNKEDKMAITTVSRWKGDREKAFPIARGIAPMLKRHGAVSVRFGDCHSGPYAGQMFVAITYPDGATYGRALQAQSEDAQFQKAYAEASKIAELQDRSVLVTQDL
jgi:hypothetical protein